MESEALWAPSPKLTIELYHAHAYLSRLIKLSGFDIIMLRDGGEHFSYVTNDMRRPFFEAMSRAVPIDRLREKLDLAAEYSEEIVTWGYREYCRPALGDAARKWYDDYKAYVRGRL